MVEETVLMHKTQETAPMKVSTSNQQQGNGARITSNASLFAAKDGPPQTGVYVDGGRYAQVALAALQRTVRQVSGAVPAGKLSLRHFSPNRS